MIHSKRYLAKWAFYSFQGLASYLIWPYFRLRRHLFPENQARILTYHCVSQFPKEREIPYDNVPPELFADHMHILEKEHCQVVSLSDLVHMLEANQTIPPKTIVITFDDGYKNNYLNALPVLEKMGFKASFFIIAGGLGMQKPFKHLLWDEAARTHFRSNPETRLPMNALEVRGILEEGHEIGSHGLTHRSVGNLPYKEGMEEIIRSKEILEDVIGENISLFAYPFGAKSYNDFNQRTSSMLMESGFKAACTGEIGSITLGNGLYELARIPIRETDTPFRFKQKLYGAFDWINPFKRAFQKAIPRIDKAF